VAVPVTWAAGRATASVSASTLRRLGLARANRAGSGGLALALPVAGSRPSLRVARPARRAESESADDNQDVSEASILPRLIQAQQLADNSTETLQEALVGGAGSSCEASCPSA